MCTHQLLVDMSCILQCISSSNTRKNPKNSSYNSTWLNINQLYDDDQQSKQSIARQLDSTQQYSVNNIQF